MRGPKFQSYHLGTTVQTSPYSAPTPFLPSSWGGPPGVETQGSTFPGDSGSGTGRKAGPLRRLVRLASRGVNRGVCRFARPPHSAGAGTAREASIQILRCCNLTIQAETTTCYSAIFQLRSEAGEKSSPGPHQIQRNQFPHTHVRCALASRERTLRLRSQLREVSNETPFER